MSQDAETNKKYKLKIIDLSNFTVDNIIDATNFHALITLSNEKTI